MALIDIDGINYVLNTKTSSAEVWRLEKYDRDIIDIPPYISYGSVKYRVTEIASGAFKSLSNVRFIKIPDTVISIGDNAFEGTAWYGNLPNGIIYVNNVLYRYKGDMPANTNVVIPEGIISISPHAFEYCDNLTSVVIPKTVTHIGMGAFSMCTSLKDVVIPDSVTSIDYAAFANTKWFNDLPDGLVYINNVLYTYKGSKKINPTIVINEGVVSITSHALSEPFGRLDSVSYDLISLTIPDSVTHIGDHAFSKCMKLTTVKLPSNISCIGYGTFEDCSSLTTINIPNGIESIGDSAFKNCKSLKVLEIPTSVVSIGDCAFDGCSALNSITIPNSVTKIGRGLFRGCTSLSSINISPRVTYVGDNAFKETAWYNNQENGLVYIHKILYKYKGDMPTNTNIVIPEGIISISPDAFEDCENLTSITIPSTVKNIGNGAFLFCRSLKNVTIPNGVKELSTYMFNQCSSLSSICLPESIETIGYDVFYHVESLKEIIIPKGTKERFLQMGLQNYEHLLVERDNEEISILLNSPTTKYIFFDTECNGLPKYYNIDVCITSNWPRLIQLAWIVTDEIGNIVKRQNYIIKPDGFVINDKIAVLTSINTARAQREGVELVNALSEFMADIEEAQLVIGHNIDFDMHIVGCELFRENMNYNKLMTKPSICTMQKSTNFCAIPSNGNHARYKWPKLEELHQKLFGTTFSGAHDAMSDVEATRKCYFELKKKGIL